MSIFNKRGQAIAPDRLAEQGRCPECGGNLDEVIHDEHIAKHWPKDRSTEALRRIELIRTYGKTAKGKAAQEKLEQAAQDEAAAAREAETPAD